ncbi:uncharacterized protein GBIM_05364 [Gryllus bimaculatus]|nr:uncharacterized protein GBIM_05364 [Gryllus bimaculatus]
MEQITKKQAELLKKGELDSDADVTVKTAQDLEDAYQDEFSKFQFAARQTDCDKRKDLKSLDRALDKYLVLVVNQKIGDDYRWILPQGLRENGETMRQTAERVLAERCGTKLQATFLGNAPCGFYKYKYPQSVRSSSKAVGAKVFFFKAWHIGGNVECSKTLIKDFKWLCTEDLNSTLQNDVYYNSVSQFLIVQ